MARSRILWFGLLAAVLFPLAAAAQPFNSYLALNTGDTGYVQIPAAGFDFSTGFTFEAWVSVRDAFGPGGCSSIAGKDYTKAFWIGVCGTTLRSYIKGSGSLFDGGRIPANDWVHIAVTYDGANRKHYIDGEEVATRAETGNMTLSPGTAVRIGSDVSWLHTANGAYDEVRFWTVARTKEEIRANITKTINAPQAGLLAVYHFDANANDAIGGRNGTTTGSAGFLNNAVTASCTTTAEALCLQGNKFLVQTKWIDYAGNFGNGKVVPGSSADSGLFWFFNAANWEVLVKVLNACPGSGKWVFAAATTDVHYELIVTNVTSGEQKRYFNYLGTPAPAVTDTGAYPTACP